jgi:hypothetical protein
MGPGLPENDSRPLPANFTKRCLTECLRNSGPLGKTPEFVFVQEYCVPRELEDQAGCRPTEGTKKSVEGFGGTDATQFDVNQAPVPIRQLAIDLPAVLSRLSDPDERSIGLEEQPRQLLQTVGRLFKADRHRNRLEQFTSGQSPAGPTV